MRPVWMEWINPSQSCRIHEHIHKNSQYFHTHDNKILWVNIFQNIILYTNIYKFKLCSLCRKLYTCLHEEKNVEIEYILFFLFWLHPYRETPLLQYKGHSLSHKHSNRWKEGTTANIHIVLRRWDSCGVAEKYNNMKIYVHYNELEQQLI